MKTAIAFLAAGALSAALPAVAQEAEAARFYEAEAVVQTIDLETRQVLLRDRESGEVFVVRPGPEAVNLPQLKPGDVVRATYVRDVAARMALPGEAGAASVAGVVAAPEGGKPGVLMGETMVMVLTFEGYDAETNLVTVRDDDGAESALFVREPAMRAFAAGLSPGDRVEVTVVETLAIGVVQ